MGMFTFVPVERQKSKLRMAIEGVASSGKTLGSLYIAYGITQDWSKIALIDTEHERARFYANRTDLGTGAFLYCPFSAPYSPERCKAAVQEAAEAVGPDGVVIFDSFSHAWAGEGGMLDVNQKNAYALRGNTYAAWNTTGKIQDNLVNSIFSVQAHTIVTMRSKMEYVQDRDDSGRSVIRKVGLAPVQRDNVEYEFDIALSIDRNHIARLEKDVTFLDGFVDTITPELGRRIAEWLSEGKEPELCACCHRAINPFGGRDVATVIAGTTKTTGRQMCGECFGKWQLIEKQKEKLADDEYATLQTLIGESSKSDIAQYINEALAAK